MKLRLNEAYNEETGKYEYADLPFCQKRTHEYLDDWFLDENTGKILKDNLTEQLILYIDSDVDTLNCMFKDYTITKRNTIHWNRTVESIVWWDGFCKYVKDTEYSNVRADISTLSRQLKKWLETRSNLSGDNIYSILNDVYKYYKDRRIEKEAEILK